MEEVRKDRKIAFVLAGTGHLEKLLKRKAERLPNLFLAGWIPKTSLQRFLRSVDICYAGLLNIRSFAYGSDSTKLYEYMKASRPILHAIGDINSVVVRAECGLRVAPESGAALAKGVETMAGMNQAELKALGRKAFEFVRTQRNYDVLTDKWIAMFERLKRHSEQP